MAKFIFLYSGGAGMAESEEAQAAVMEAWNQWFGSLGGSLADGGEPFGASATVSGTDSVRPGGSLNATGYTAVNADSLDAATEIAKGCPLLTVGGTVDVYEAISM